MARIMAGMVAMAITSLIMAFVIGIILFAPKPYPRLHAVVKPDHGIADGRHVTHYWVGLLKEEWTYRDGVPHGTAYQFYPNGSLLRRLPYENGRLNGVAEEFYEKPGRARGVPKRLAPRQTPQIKLGAGQIKARWTYADGERHGPFERFDKKGRLKERGIHEHGRKLKEEDIRVLMAPEGR